jgi:hypothetical protein
MNSQVLEYIEDVMKCRKNFANGEYGKMTPEQFKERMKERFATFEEKYPTIFEKSVDGFFEKPEEMKRLRMAMGLISKTNDGEISKEDGEKAFGQHLVDVFVRPNVPESARSQKNPF